MALTHHCLMVVCCLTCSRDISSNTGILLHRRRCSKYLEYYKACLSLNRRVADARKAKQQRQIEGQRLAGPSTHPTYGVVQDPGPIRESPEPDSPYPRAPSPPPPPHPSSTATGRPYRQR